MYHATGKIKDVASVLDHGFKISQGDSNRNLLLGDGLYVSRDIYKTQEYGEVTSSMDIQLESFSFCRYVSSYWSTLAKL